MTVGFEWLIDAEDCDADALRDVEILRLIFERVISDLNLKTIGAGAWHKFAGAGGVTGLIMLTESHLACHTYPEYSSATFNLYCCKSRPEWDWQKHLAELLGAQSVKITKFERGRASENKLREMQNGAAQNLKNIKTQKVEPQTSGDLEHSAAASEIGLTGGGR